MQEFTLKVSAEDKGRRLDVFVFQKLTVGAVSCGRPIGVSREIIKKLILNGEIVLNGGKASPHQKVKDGDVIAGAYRDTPVVEIIPQKIPIDIVYEDDDVIIINKQAGLVVHPAVGRPDNTLVNGLVYVGAHRDVPLQLSDVDPKRPGIVHRLDKETSGLMLVAKNNLAHYYFVKQFSRHLIERHYAALVKGKMEFDEGVINAAIGKHPKDFRKMTTGISREEKEALTRYKTLKRAKDWSLLELIPETGRTHQLRVHLASIGHPILGDEKYGKKEGHSRLFLHAKTIKFTHPKTKETLEFTSEIPIEFKEILSSIDN